MAQQGRKLAALAEDLSSVPRTHVRGSSEPPVIPAPRDPITSSGLPGHLHACVQMRTCRHTYVN